MKTFIIITMCLICIMVNGCATGYKEYAKAIQEQNVTIQLMNERIERERQENEHHMEKRRMQHREKMAKLLEHTMTATSKTKDKTDDVIAPLLIATLEDKWAISDMLLESKKKTNTPIQMMKIEAPEKTSDIIKASTAPVLGAFGIYAGIRNTEKMADIAIEGMANSGVHNTVSGENNRITNDSYKSNTDNTVNGNKNALSGGKVGCSNCDDDQKEISSDSEMPSSCSGVGFFQDDTWWIRNGCSCDSHERGDC